MKIIRYMDCYLGGDPEYFGFTSEKFLTWPIPIGNKRYRIEFEIPDPVIDGVVEGIATEVKNKNENPV